MAKKTPKVTQYRRLLERLFAHIRTYSNMDDVRDGNTTSLRVENPWKIRDWESKFQEIKKQR